MGLVGNKKTPFHGNAVAPEPFDLFKKRLGVNHDPVADDADFSGMKDPGGNLVEDKFTVLDPDRVTRIISSLKTSDDVATRGQEIDHFPFPFISPLGTDQNAVHVKVAPETRLQLHEFDIQDG